MVEEFKFDNLLLSVRKLGHLDPIHELCDQKGTAVNLVCSIQLGDGDPGSFPDEFQGCRLVFELFCVEVRDEAFPIW